ncbi:MAG TPA: Na+/H+ antiporter subunit D [Verrucomicrobia bacterium]|nr:MAG: NADH/ubiquinone/plastoquinone [Lentisphaerae bacterium GWF2_57_35]HBA84440.1 Na+/H+ antiporter subunit D [Verrucomicrobiota bacterium]
MLLVLPIIIPLVIAASCLIALRRIVLHQFLTLAGCIVLLANAALLFMRVRHAGYIVLPIGSWPAPFGIVFVCDVFSAMMVFMTALIGLLIAIYSIAGVDAARKAHGFYPLVNILLVGVNGAFLTGDLFNLYVWFEVLLIASFVLMSLGGERRQMAGAIKYVTLNLMSSALFLTAAGILYGKAGTLNMAHLALAMRESPPETLMVVEMLFLTAFGIKAAMFPLFFWLPAAYHTPPVAVTALFSALLTKVGVYAIIRVFALVFGHGVEAALPVILVLAGMTMITGVLGAVDQYDFRRLLSFHMVSQIGYLLIGPGLFTPAAMAGAIFFMIHIILTKTALFLACGIAGRLNGSFQLKEMHGLLRASPILAALFLIAAGSLAGVPPLPGFFAKLFLLLAAFSEGRYALAAVALAVSFLTFFSMLKIWNEAFWKTAPQPVAPAGPIPFSLLSPLVVLCALILLLTLFGHPFHEVCRTAAAQLLNSDGYIAAVRLQL